MTWMDLEHSENIPEVLHAFNVKEDYKSIGSKGHPVECKECQFYFFAPTGCRSGADCLYCHEVHPRKNPKKNRRILRRIATKENGSGSAEETPPEPMGGASTGPSSLLLATAMPLPVPAAPLFPGRVAAPSGEAQDHCGGAPPAAPAPREMPGVPPWQAGGRPAEAVAALQETTALYQAAAALASAAGLPLAAASATPSPAPYPGPTGQPPLASAARPAALRRAAPAPQAPPQTATPLVTLKYIRDGAGAEAAMAAAKTQVAGAPSEAPARASRVACVLGHPVRMPARVDPLHPDSHQALQASLHFSISPPLPKGLTLSTRTGLISGVPSAASARTLYTVTLSTVAVSSGGVELGSMVLGSGTLVLQVFDLANYEVLDAEEVDCKSRNPKLVIELRKKCT